MNKTTVGGATLSKLNATISHNTNKRFANARKDTNAQHSEVNYRFSHLNEFIMVLAMKFICDTSFEP